MKLLFLTAFLLCALDVSSQNRLHFYVTHSNDTIDCEMLSYSNKRIYIAKDGKVVSLNAKKIKAFTFYSDHTYHNFVTLKNDKKRFYEEDVVGKLSLYKNYTEYNKDPYFVIVKDDKIYHISLLNCRSITGKLVADCKPVYDLWLQKKFSSYDPSIIVNLYNYYTKN